MPKSKHKVTDASCSRKGDKKSCIGCGYCCVKCPCVFGQILHYFKDFKDRCPYLKWKKTRYVCYVMDGHVQKKKETTQEYLISVMVKELLCGKCENPKNHWRRDVKQR